MIKKIKCKQITGVFKGGQFYSYIILIAHPLICFTYF